MQPTRHLRWSAAPGRRTRQRSCVTLCVVAFTVLASPAVTRGAGTPAYTSASTRVEEPLRQYRALRRMHAWTEHAGQEAWMDVWTELKNGRFEYQIVSE